MDKKQTFSELVKSEVCHLEYNEDCAKVILQSFFINNSEFIMNGSQKYYVLNSHYNFVIRFIKKLITILDESIVCEIKTSNIKNPKLKTKYIISINDFEKIDNYLDNLKFPTKTNEDQKRSFILGGFLSSGSIYFSQSNSNYHFEIRSSNMNYLKLISKYLNHFQIIPTIISYRNSYKLYFKKSESIGDLLKLLGTTETLYQFEDFRIQKDHINSLQRMNNLDISNINKTIIASSNQLKWIQTIINKNAFSELDEKAQIFANIRREFPEESLSSIAEKMSDLHNITIPRTSLNHIIRRIEKLYLKVR
ncbi:MAG: DNA-binding protein WhiA [Mycoplasma sp.]